MSEPFIIAGLGNPGNNYADTRHNIGFMIVDQLAARLGFELGREKWSARWTSVDLWQQRGIVIKPITYMNRSGQAAARFIDFYKVPLERVLVIHDDLDMHPGRIKLVKGGGAGGHNGIRSLVTALGGTDFFRLKIGIGRPGQGEVHPDMPVEKYVLAPLPEGEKRLLDERLEIIEQGVEHLFCDSPARAMNLLNSLK
ncbi:MAG: aminoacyl-tRNA hydrolase [Thermodesulfobacteriota bacterium]